MAYHPKDMSEKSPKLDLAPAVASHSPNPISTEKGRKARRAGNKPAQRVPRSVVLNESETGRLYREIESLMLAGGQEEAIAAKTTELRRLQQIEADRMSAYARSQSQLQPGHGYALLDKAARLLDK